jgi:hypothetical protein
MLVIMPGSIAICGVGHGLADALRAFVHVQEVAHAVAGAVAEVDALGPQRRARQASSIGLSVPRGKRVRDRHRALEHQRVVALHRRAHACRWARRA